MTLEKTPACSSSAIASQPLYDARDSNGGGTVTRTGVIEEIVRLTNGGARLVNAGDGWPSIIDVVTDAGTKRLAVYCSAFAMRGYRGRDHIERRMQNPENKLKRAVLPVAGAVPVILGLWTEGPRAVVVAFDAPSRFGETTRKSFFASLPHLAVAVEQGWTSYRSGSDEEVFAFWPTMLPAYADMVSRGVHLDPEEMAGLVEASGLAEAAAPLSAEERVRRTASVLVRRAAFSAEVVAAYERLCAMCGLNFGLVQGAHIYPASAPGSSDDVRNGVALCANHHAAFDRHLIYVGSRSGRVMLHPTMLEARTRNEACDAFVRSTLPELRQPASSAARPHPDMFEKRYDLFDEAYRWAA